MDNDFDNENVDNEQRQPQFFFGMQPGAGGFFGPPFFQPGMMPGFPQMQPPSGQPPFGQPPFGQPPFGQPPFGQPPFGQPPFGQPPFGQPPFGQPPGGPAGGGPPSGPPPSFVPSVATAQQTIGPYAVDPGAIRPCLFRFVYIWLVTGQQFWAWLVFVGRESAAGWRWTGFRWVYFGIDLSQISAFVCY